MKAIRFHPEAEREVYASIRHYDKECRGLGLRFQQAVDRGLAHIREFPQTGIPSAGETRTLTIRPFPYGIVFKEYNDEFRVIAIHHYHRRKDYWVRRLDDLDEE